MADRVRPRADPGACVRACVLACIHQLMITYLCYGRQEGRDAETGWLGRLTAIPPFCCQEPPGVWWEGGVCEVKVEMLQQPPRLCASTTNVCGDHVCTAPHAANYCPQTRAVSHTGEYRQRLLHVYRLTHIALRPHYVYATSTRPLITASPLVF